MDFEWDNAKDEANRRKHGLDFDLAVRAFEGPCVTLPARSVAGERRMLTIGQIEDLTIVAIVHTDRQGRTRLISARRASRREREMFHVHCARET